MSFKERVVGNMVWLRVYDRGRLVCHAAVLLTHYDRDPDAAKWYEVDDPRRKRAHQAKAT